MTGKVLNEAVKKELETPRLVKAERSTLLQFSLDKNSLSASDRGPIPGINLEESLAEASQEEPSTRRSDPGGLPTANRQYRCRFVQAGRVRGFAGQPGRLEISPKALAQAWVDELFEGRAVFIDHAGGKYPSLRNLAGVTLDSHFDDREASVHGTISLYDTAAGQAAANLLDQVLSSDNPPDEGLSLVFWPVMAPPLDEDSPPRVDAILHVESVDLVFEPAAGGRVLEALSSLAGVDAIGDSAVAFASAIHGGINDVSSTNIGQATACSRITGRESNHFIGGRNSMKDENKLYEKIQGEIAEAADSDPHSSGVARVDGVGGGDPNPAQDWLNALGQTAALSILAASGLPSASRERLSQVTYKSPDDVTQAVADERTYLARLQEDQVIQMAGPAPRGSVTTMRSSLDQVGEALEALLAGRRPATAHPLSGIRELYHLLSGDYEMNGVFQPERVTLANVNSSSMANLVANALNKRVVNEFMQYPHWWAPVVIEEDFTTLQQVKWITLGGVGELPTVSEGATYSELSWDDAAETASFVKKGGYLGITLEAIDKDDTGRLRAAPRALAQAAWLTLTKAVSGVFTDNAGVGPTLSDSVALFASGHGNLGSTALSIAAYAATAWPCASRPRSTAPNG